MKVSCHISVGESPVTAEPYIQGHTPLRITATALEVRLLLVQRERTRASEREGVLLQRAQVGYDFTDVFSRQLTRERWHLALLSVADTCDDLFIRPVQIVQVRPFVAVRVRAVAMSAVPEEQLPASRRHGQSSPRGNRSTR